VESGRPTIKIGRVYLITNQINNKKYVGITTKTLKLRWWQHCYVSEKKTARAIGKAIKHFGKENFRIELMDELQNISQKDLLFKETFYIDKYDTFIDGGNGYNLVKENEANLIWSDISKKKMSDNRRGEKNQFFGKRHSEETKKIMSQSHKGSKGRLGIPQTKETREKLSRLLSGENAGRYNPTIFQFKNHDTNEEFVGTQFHFRKKYNLKNSTLSKVINRKTKSYRGWVLVK
jgi:group I intron endonuclease